MTDLPSSQKPLTFQELVLRLQGFWAEHGCVLQQPYDVEVGAGTMAPETFLRVLGPKPYRVGYVQPSRRPADGRYGENPNRLFKHMQFQVILKPPPANVQELYLESLQAIGIDLRKHDIKFEEDNWESPTLGAWGIGWQVMLDGLEITQFTYFQQCGGIDLDPISAELTYGLERIAAFLQDVDSIYDITWVVDPDGRPVKYGEIRLQDELQFSVYNFEFADVAKAWKHLEMYEAECQALLDQYAALSKPMGSDGSGEKRKAKSEEAESWRRARSEKRRAKGCSSPLPGPWRLRSLPEVLAPVQPSGCPRRNQRDRARRRDRANSGAGSRRGQGVRRPAKSCGRNSAHPLAKNGREGWGTRRQSNRAVGGVKIVTQSFVDVPN